MWRAMAAMGLALAACNVTAEVAAPVPAAAWDGLPGAQSWTEASLAMLGAEGGAAGLVSFVPRDIDEWCPGYPDADPATRAAFWTGLLSALAEHESTWDPDVVGGGGRWFGLVQISPATARFYGCAATDGTALRDGAANIRCALRIWSQTVTRDGVISDGRQGIAADWGPLAVASQREEIRAWVRAQDYCS